MAQRVPLIFLRGFLFSFTCILCFTFFTSSVFAEQTSSTDSGATEPLILQMADGRFYHPASGLIGHSREEIIRLITPSDIAIAQGLTIAELSASTSSSTTPQTFSFPLREAILRAKAMLSDELLLELSVNPKKQTINKDDGTRVVKLVIWDSINDQLIRMEIKKKGDKILKRTGGEGILLSIRMSNYLNTEYALDSEGRYALVATSYPLYREKKSGKKVISYEITPTIYTPYGLALRTPQMIAHGKQILDGLIKQTYQSLDASAVKSRAFQDRLLTSVLDPNVAKAIAVIEHTWHKDIDKDLQGTMDRFFVQLAANENDAFAYARSTANALGLVQFIPATYKTLVNRHPELNLMENFEAGMQDLPNSVKAQVAYLDEILASLPSEAMDEYATELGKERVQEFMVAAYNGGPARVKRAMADWEEQWSPKRQAKVRTLERKQADFQYRVNTLNKKIKKEKAPSKKTLLKRDLTRATKELQQVRSELAIFKTQSLRQETLTYLIKYRKVMAHIVGQARLASAS